MAGRVRLAVTGIQDQWLTGEPQFSFFVSRFRRHTKFAIEEIETPFDGTVDFGNTVECRIPYTKGDLIKNMTLKITLTDPLPDYGGGGINSNSYCSSVCTELVEYVDLVMGGQTIERLTGEYIYMYQQLNNADDDTDQTIYFLNSHGGFLGFFGQNTFYLDLPFYFYRHASLAIPIVAMTKQLVQVVVKLKPLKNLIYGGFVEGVTASIQNMSLNCEFVFVSEEERNYLMTRQVDQVITQLQVSSLRMLKGVTEKTVMLNFTGPVKELFFICQSDYFLSNNYTNNYENITNVELKFNNYTAFNEDLNMLSYEQPLKYYVNCPSNNFQADYFNIKQKLYSLFGVYSFSMDPTVHYPTGQVNMSRIFHKMLTVQIQPSYPNNANTVRVYAVNYNVLSFKGGLAGLKF